MSKDGMKSSRDLMLSLFSFLASFTSPQGRFHPRTLGFILKLLERVKRNKCVGYFSFFLKNKNNYRRRNDYRVY